MPITESFKSKTGQEYVFEYRDADNFDDLDPGKCTQTYGVCFCDGKLVIGFGGRKKDWGLIGGTIEPGETFEQTLRREIQEEANMEVLSMKPIGYQKVLSHDGICQLRYACTVRPFGPFVSDPAGSVTEIKLIDPADYKKYFDWGRIGDRIMERALELVKK